MENSNSTCIFSTGGIGDTLIVGLKIQKIKKYRSEQIQNPVICWDHTERHDCHLKPIFDIMKSFVEANLCIANIHNSPEIYSNERCKDFGGLKVNTRIMGIVDPYLEKPINMGIDTAISLPYIVIQKAAGRMNDSTKREIGDKVIEQILDEFPDRQIVLLGPPECYKSYSKYPRIINRIGKTTSIVDAMGWITDARLTIAQDGILAYYSMMLRRPTIIHYHDPALINHYYNQEWAYHSIALFGAGNYLEELDIKNNEIQILFDKVRGL